MKEKPFQSDNVNEIFHAINLSNGTKKQISIEFLLKISYVKQFFFCFIYIEDVMVLNGDKIVIY